MAIDLSSLSITKAHKHLARGDFSARDLAAEYLSAIKTRNADLNAYLEVYDDVLEQAEEADARLKKGDATPMTGIPLALKDNLLVTGKRVSSSSKILEGYVAPYDATVIRKLKDAGAIFLGRTNMDEFAMGASTETSAFGPSRNPHDTLRVPGGSSGGAAVAVASQMALAALGSDTGGSVRQPAAFCGVVGLKPTYGAVSRYGLMAMGSSLDQVGPITNSVSDSRILFEAISGKDPLDSTSLDISIYPKPARKKKLVIGVPRSFTETEGIDSDVIENFNTSLKRLTSLGFAIKDISLPNISYALAVYYIIMPAEASTNLARFDGVKYGLHRDGENLLGDYLKTRGSGFGSEVRRRILLGTYVLSSGYYDAYYGKANSVRELITQDFAEAFHSVDAVAMPTTPSPAFRFGEKTGDPLAMYLADIFTVTANITGLPAISVPSGDVVRQGKRLPLGLQLIAPHGAEETLFSIGGLFCGEKDKAP